jgi:hypothetical protein
MAKIGEAAVLKRAKRLCKKNGTTWDATELRAPSPGAKNVGVIDDEGRKRYLAIAKEQLLKEQRE